jgi:TPP-dependent pyruvate/acetoin dehydrogenase alpha subunit
MAGFLRVPAVFICINNQYGISTYIGDVLAGGSIAKRAAGYGIPGIEVAVYEAGREAVARGRSGNGPSLIEAVTCRIGGHSSTAPEDGFMDQKKLREFPTCAMDQTVNFAATLTYA